MEDRTIVQGLQVRIPIKNHLNDNRSHDEYARQKINTQPRPGFDLCPTKPKITGKHKLLEKIKEGKNETKITSL